MTRLPEQHRHPGVIRVIETWGMSMMGSSVLLPFGMPSRISAVVFARCCSSSGSAATLTYDGSRMAAAMAASRFDEVEPVTSVSAVRRRCRSVFKRVSGLDLRYILFLQVLFRQLSRLDAELFQLTIQVRPFEPRLFGHTGHAATLAQQVMFEIGTLECIAGLA